MTNNKRTKLKVCDWMLLIITLAALASGIQLEVLSGASVLWIWMHIILCVAFFGLIVWHLQLHFQWYGWPRRLWKSKSSDMKWLTVFGFLTLLSAFICTAGWLVSPDHSRVGAVHGKIGFIFIGVAAFHILRRFKFYKS